MDASVELRSTSSRWHDEVGMGPIKRSMMIAGHSTSISLEPVFWDALRAAAEAEGLPLNALVARIDAERIEARATPNLASAMRVWLFERERCLRS